MIFNHFASTLSDLDMEIIQSVPEGGNWKNIPVSVPSKRLQQIRESFKRGEGSRSTYYGRLSRQMPSYTINTYFNRPGNGCHIHYEQDRTLSQREAARLQSFPDSFEFIGSQGAIQTQIGNAVPPLLAYQIANSLGRKGLFVDLFCGAGGMGLGFKWAGWTPVVANDIDKKCLNTYARNVHENCIEGDITNTEIFHQIIRTCRLERKKGTPFWVLGGPPCQGFSTAGNKRSDDDPRNKLVWTYLEFLKELEPDGFVFENVPGLLNMNKGSIYKSLKKAFSDVMALTQGEVFSSEEFGIPQRRKRVIIVGMHHERGNAWKMPAKITAHQQDHSLTHLSLHQAVSVEEALSDLPFIEAGKAATDLTYKTEPLNNYQMLMRGLISPGEYVKSLMS